MPVEFSLLSKCSTWNIPSAGRAYFVSRGTSCFQIWQFPTFRMTVCSTWNLDSSDSRAESASVSRGTIRGLPDAKLCSSPRLLPPTCGRDARSQTAEQNSRCYANSTEWELELVQMPCFHVVTPTVRPSFDPQAANGAESEARKLAPATATPRSSGSPPNPAPRSIR